jgi:hypothetical protein
VSPQHRRQRVRRLAVPTLGTVKSYPLLQLLPGNQPIHPFQKDFAACLSLFASVLGFGGDQLIYGGCKFYGVNDGTIIADLEESLRGFLY